MTPLHQVPQSPNDASMQDCVDRRALAGRRARRVHEIQVKGQLMLRFARNLLAVFLTIPMPGTAAQEPKPLPQPDERYKADILVMVAHPDDEAAVTPYVARALDEHKRIAVV